MACIDFTGPLWGDLATTARACSSGPNTFSDTANGVSFIIASGSMNVTDFQGNRMLFFTPADCDGTTVHPAVTLIIQFTAPRERVTFRLNFDEHGSAPAVVNYYRQAGNPDPANLSGSQRFEWNGNQFFDVVYDNCCNTVREITIRTDRLENSLDDLCWGLSQRRQTFWGRAVCLCIAKRFLDSIRRWLDAIGSLFRQPAKD